MYVNPYNIDRAPQKNDRRGPFVLGITATGKFVSYFKNKELPVKDYKDFLEESKGTSRIVVFGTSQFADKDEVLIPNTVDWLCQDEDLIAIRVKSVGFRPLKSISFGLRLAYKYICIFLLPIIVIIFGIFRWIGRSKYRKILKEIYA